MESLYILLRSKLYVQQTEWDKWWSWNCHPSLEGSVIRKRAKKNPKLLNAWAMLRHVFAPGLGQTKWEECRQTGITHFEYYFETYFYKIVLIVFNQLSLKTIGKSWRLNSNYICIYAPIATQLHTFLICNRFQDWYFCLWTCLGSRPRHSQSRFHRTSGDRDFGRSLGQ